VLAYAHAHDWPGDGDPSVRCERLASAMKRRPKCPPGMYGSEAELCQTLIDSARSAGYQAHPECGEWDSIIVDRGTGAQIGVHSKLRPNVSVLSQALADERLPGPEIHAVLVPAATQSFLEVAKALRVYVIQGVFLDWLDLPEIYRYAVRWMHPNRHWVPEVEMRFPAGVPAPRKMTPWKVSAVKLSLLAREKGFVTSLDMRKLELDPRWWLSPRYGAILTRRLIDGVRQRGEYVLRDPSSRLVPDLKFPEITTALQVREIKQPRMRVKQKPESTPAKTRSTLLPPPTAEAESEATGLRIKSSTDVAI
jgi:hypothetical protein